MNMLFAASQYYLLTGKNRLTKDTGKNGKKKERKRKNVKLNRVHLHKVMLNKFIH